MNASIYGHLRLHFQKDPTAAFLPFLQKGFYIEISTGNLLEMVCRTCGLDALQVHQRIQTVFLNGKPVDDMATAYVQDNDCLALSAAMPGLAGATLRRGSVYAAMRHQVTHDALVHSNIGKEGLIELKLFNLVARDIGPMFLIQGIRINAEKLINFLRKVPDHFWAGCRVVEINGTPCQPDELTRIDWEKQQILLELKVR